MIILAIDASLACCSVALVRAGVVLAEARQEAATGQAGILPLLAQRVLMGAGGFDLVAVTVGPGGFTGVRTGLALAHGLALGAGARLAGVTTGQALAEAAWARHGRGRDVLSVIDSRRGHVFVQRLGAGTAMAPVAMRPDEVEADGMMLAGDGVGLLPCHEGAMDSLVRLPSAMFVASAWLAGMAADEAPWEPRPLYIDPPSLRA